MIVKNNHVGIAVLAALTVLLFPAGKTFAQVLRDDNVVSVKDRMKTDPYYSPAGIKAGAFLLHPGIDLTETYDDNIFRTASGRQSDFITSVAPSFLAETTWDIHEISFTAQGDLGLYADNGDENYADYETALGGRYDLGYNTFLSAAVSFDRRHEERRSPNDIRGDEPTVYNVFEQQAGFTRALGKIKFNASALNRNYAFEDTDVSGTSVDNGFRDRTQQVYTGKIAYEFIPNYQLYGQLAYDVQNYDRSGTRDRSSKGFDAKVGTAVNITGKLRGDVYAGLLDRRYENNFEDLETANYGGSLIWNLSGLTSVKTGVSREVIEATTGTFSSYVRTDAQLSVEHALRQNILLDSSVGWMQDDFTGGTGRTDETVSAGVGLAYKPNRTVTLGMEYDFEDRDSDTPAADYTDNRFSLSAGARF